MIQAISELCNLNSVDAEIITEDLPSNGERHPRVISTWLDPAGREEMTPF
jgi:hypothetical protein